METKQAVLPLSAPVSTSILLCFGNRHNHITVFDETIFVSSMTLYQQAVSSYIQRPFCVAKCLLGNPKPFQICIVPMQATRFYKTLFGCAIGVRSHHGSTMITGFEVLPAQAALVAVSICTKPKRTQYPQPRQ